MTVINTRYHAATGSPLSEWVPKDFSITEERYPGYLAAESTSAEATHTYVQLGLAQGWITPIEA